MKPNKISISDEKHDSSRSHCNQSPPGTNTRSLDMPDVDIFPELISELLKEGHKVRFRAPGKSMQPAVLDGDVLIVEPVEVAAIKIGDIILYQTEERLIAHRVKRIEKIECREHQPAKPKTKTSLAQSNPAAAPANEKFYAFLLCGDASFSYDEPVYSDQIMGKATAIERDERTINPYSLAYRLICRVRVWASRLKRTYF